MKNKKPTTTNENWLGPVRLKRPARQWLGPVRLPASPTRKAS
jgi:hypothetical protein